MILRRKKAKPEEDRSAMVEAIAAATGVAAPTQPQAASGYTPPKSRRGRVAITTYHDPSVAQQLREISVATGTTQQKLIAEGLNYIFAKHSKPKIAEQ